jgi:hypothetical protein
VSSTITPSNMIVHLLIEGDLAGTRAVAIEEFDTRSHLQAFKSSSRTTTRRKPPSQGRLPASSPSPSSTW